MHCMPAVLRKELKMIMHYRYHVLINTCIEFMVPTQAYRRCYYIPFVYAFLFDMNLFVWDLDESVERIGQFHFRMIERGKELKIKKRKIDIELKEKIDES